MFYRFGFESKIYAELSLIPLHVRMKLDLTGTKISLKSWLAFSLEERAVLCHLPVETQDERETFASYIDFLSGRYFGEKARRVPPATAPPWEDTSRIPDSVQTKSQQAGHAVTLKEWSRWHLGQRYALLKLSVSKNEPETFYAALQEFREEKGK